MQLNHSTLVLIWYFGIDVGHFSCIEPVVGGYNKGNLEFWQDPAGKLISHL